jgi:hypothetical protein
MVSLLLIVGVIISLMTTILSQGQDNPLEVDINEFIYSTFLGGSNRDLIRDGIIDSDGNIIVTGQTLSPDFPTVNPFQSNYSGGSYDQHEISGDGIVSKFDPLGQILWSTYIGGTNQDSGQSVRVDASNNIFIVGLTNSRDFPVTSNAAEPNFLGGTYDLFIAKFSPSGELLYSSYFGTAGDEYNEEFDLDSSGNLVIVGVTSSANLPVTSDAYQSSRCGASDGFIIHLANDCSTIQYCSYFGGRGWDMVGSIDINNNDDIYVSGVTTSSSEFPLTENAFQTNLDTIHRDFFFAKFDSSNNLVYSTFFGGSHMDDCFGLSIDSQGQMFISGRTWSDDFPIKKAFQETKSQGDNPDGYIAKFSADGKQSWTSYFGGSGWDTVHFVKSDSNDNILATGIGGSDGFPQLHALQEHSGSSDVVLMLLSSTGKPIFSSYLGGSNVECPYSLSLSNNLTLIVGMTDSSDFLVSPEAFQTNLSNDTDGFIFRFDYVNYLAAKGVTTKSASTSGFNILLGCFGVATALFIRKKHRN